MSYKFSADLPYPQVDIKVKSPIETRLLMSVYGGRESETTAIMGYIYASYVTSDELSDCLRKIAINEMHHHSMLGKAIAELGGTPYIGGTHSYWQGGFVNYVKDPVAILKNNIANEHQAIRDYQFVISRTSIPDIRLLAERIILDEEVHIETLTELLATFKNK